MIYELPDFCLFFCTWCDMSVLGQLFIRLTFTTFSFFLLFSAENYCELLNDLRDDVSCRCCWCLLNVADPRCYSHNQRSCHWKIQLDQESFELLLLNTALMYNLRYFISPCESVCRKGTLRSWRHLLFAWTTTEVVLSTLVGLDIRSATQLCKIQSRNIAGV